jgi:hypothetical protein
MKGGDEMMIDEEINAKVKSCISAMFDPELKEIETALDRLLKDYEVVKNPLRVVGVGIKVSGSEAYRPVELIKQWIQEEKLKRIKNKP